MKKMLPWIVRIIVAVLFIVSAFSKMYNPDTGNLATWQFEKQLVDLGLCDWCQSPFFARAIIGLEYAIGFGLLISHWIKRLTIPATVLLLVAFIIHLVITGNQYGFTNGNCGCFGQLIPMTPIEAIVKNILTIAMLVYLWFNVTEAPKGINNLIYPIAIFLATELFVFASMPFAPCKKKVVTPPVDSLTPTHSLLDTLAISPASGDTTLTTKIKQTDTGTLANKAIQDTTNSKVKNDTRKAVATNIGSATPSGIFSTDDSKAPAATKSRFAPFIGNFIGGNIALDEGKKIVCMFAPGCEHCQGVAKDLCKIKSAHPDFPEVAILFMDEEAEKIPEFFKVAGCTFPYQVLDIGTFWTTLGTGNTPGVFAQWKGNSIKSWEGINENGYKNGAIKAVWK
jgi:uncharacterized membrane protein YphA (DoxX/SURF4 family)